ncbi:glycosyltransferase family 2 protein [Elstera cyanobacteriorum]|uniref:glycosyltransferase family 2 protein n=1 Tax=Elstera cyanobacteriorum TaxID=2022747 RepID=UPI0023565592|nr:glycosyltransferase family 2 protein [Elstera cyanobacteriorum]MCK6443506.1 glycosyltransferase family 2 protein [Elstera cyanobacteriorum]
MTSVDPEFSLPTADDPISLAGPPPIRVMIVNYNGGTDLARCVEALLAQTMSDFEAVIVDNGSIDGSLDGLPADPRVTVLRMGKNLGFAAGNNQAAAGAATPWLVMLNPDAFPAPDWLELLLDEAALHGDCVAFGSTQVMSADPSKADGLGDCFSPYGFAWRGGCRKPLPVPVPAGESFAACAAAMMIRRDWFEKLGGFDERFFCYGEDVDLCFRLRLAGGRIWQSNRARVAHVGSATSGGAHSSFSLYHGYRNQIWVIAKNMPGPILPVTIFTYLPLLLLRCLLLKRPGMIWVVLKATFDGLTGLAPFWADRAELQKTRVGTFRIARVLSWSPLALIKRRAKLV